MKRKFIVITYRLWFYICSVIGFVLIAIIPAKQRFNIAKLLFGHFKRRLGGKRIIHQLAHSDNNCVIVPDVGQDILSIFLRYYKYTVFYMLLYSLSIGYSNGQIYQINHPMR